MSLDYSRRNLRGQSFKGKNLAGADFSQADIRSADFSNANLAGANFEGAKAGLQRRWVIFLISISFLLLLLSGICSSVTGLSLALIFDGSITLPDIPILGTILGWVNLVIVIIFYIVTIRQGITATFGGFAVLFAVFTAFIITMAAIADISFAIFGSIIFSGAVTFSGVVIGAIALAVALAVAFPAALPVVGIVVVALAVAGAKALIGNVDGGAVTYLAAIAFTLFNAYIGWRAIKGDEKQALIRNIAVVFAATGGTSFRGANLTDADFTGAILKNTDLRKAILIRTCWRDIKKLDLVRPGNTYLNNTKVRQLLLTRQGQDKNFDYLPLRGINLQGANLADTSFTGADLSEANLQDVDLSRAKLKQTQLDATDFTGATLTGSYIEDWGITSHTDFTGVRCEYVYMRVPNKENPDPWRKPDNREEVFADGEFGDFIQPIVDTLDLYHNQGVDPRAIAISFKQLAEKNPDAELRIVGMEVRGEDKFLLRAKISPEFDKSQFSAKYFDIYNYLKSLSPSEQIQYFLTELKVKDIEINYQKNQMIRSEDMISTLLERIERPSINSNIQIRGNVGNMTHNPGELSVVGNIGGNVNNVQGDNNRAVQGDKNQVIQGDNNQ